MDSTPSILYKVIELTNNRKMSWGQYAEDNAAFYCYIGDYLISIFKSSLSYVFTIQDKEGKNTYGTIRRISSSSGEKMREYGELKDLYEKAKRIALKIDENLDNLMNLLSNL